MDRDSAATVALALAGEAKRAANAAVRAVRGVDADAETEDEGGAAVSGSTTCTTVKSPAGTTGAVSLKLSVVVPPPPLEFGMRSGVRSSVTAATLAHAAHLYVAPVAVVAVAADAGSAASNLARSTAHSASSAAMRADWAAA